MWAKAVSNSRLDYHANVYFADSDTKVLVVWVNERLHVDHLHYETTFLFLDAATGDPTGKKMK